MKRHLESQALPTDAKPVTSKSWGSLDEAFLDIAKGIKKEIEGLKKQHLSIESKPMEGETLGSSEEQSEISKKNKKDVKAQKQIVQFG